ncbi:prosaposin [Aplochiton taeniatus]
MMLLALLFVSTAVATPLLGTEQCARGPPYWCQNVKTASLCGAVSHCQQNVWNQPQMKSVPCDLCKEVLIVVEQLIENNSTQSEILSYLEKACQLIPDEGLTAECKEMVDSYYPILIGIITGELEDPTVVCGAMGLCISQQAALAKVQAKASEQIQSNDIPQVDLAQKVAPFLLNVPQLLYPQETPKKEEALTKENGDVCEDCVKFLTDTQEQAKSNATFVNSLIAQIESQCDQLGPGISDLCKQYVSQYAPLVVQQLMSMKPKDICCSAGFCTATKKSSPMMTLVAATKIKSSKFVPALKMLPATKVEPMATEPAKPMVRARDSPQCAICEFVMKEVESMLEDESTEEDVIHAVEKVCIVLPASLSVQCKDLVEAYGQAIIELLVQQADPKTICTVLGLCKDASRAFIPKPPPPPPPFTGIFSKSGHCNKNCCLVSTPSAVMDKARFENGGFCDVCKLAIHYVDGILEQNATEAQIEDAVRKVCGFLPKSVRTECDQLIEQYEPMLIQLLLQMMDPDFVCMKVGACPEAVQRLLGAEQCSWGPAFWCKNMETANRCNAVAHCKRHVWV